MQRRPPAQESWEFPTDDAAFFDRYGPVIFAYILKHVRSREDAEDLTLEVFTAALEKSRAEKRVATAIREGMSAVEAFNKFGIM